MNLLDIIEKVCEKEEISLEDFTLLRRTRKRELVDARYIYFKIARETTDYSLEAIGNSVNKHHSTVLHGLKQVDNDNVLNAKYKNYVRSTN